MRDPVEGGHAPVATSRKWRTRWCRRILRLVPRTQLPSPRRRPGQVLSDHRPTHTGEDQRRLLIVERALASEAYQQAEGGSSWHLRCFRKQKRRLGTAH